MSLLDEFVEASRPVRPRCTVAAVLLDLESGDAQAKKRAKALREALDAEHITGSGIEKVTSTWGVRIPQNTVGRHRRGVCSCGA